MKYRKPEDMKRESKRPVSARISDGTYNYLEKRAKRAGISLSQLVENVLEDYAEWLRTQK